MKRGFLILVSLVCFATLLPMLSGMFPKEKDGITVYQAETDKTLRMPLEEFLVGVVAAEMPALFETESLKAQAVAARTYAVSRLQNGEELCTDPTHCQAYADRNTLKERWGAQFDTYYRRIADAVKATEGEIAVYAGEPIVAVFHAASSGRTENSEEVWSTDTPYLRSVESAIPAELNEMEQETVFDRPDFIHTLNTLRPTAATTP
ncbi:MAG: SpoIID/LytB domain-containing protein, partial [Clostridia bacterium]|nr:SpoIID/LytB domain-containing protein [Clostridia bacterium]